MDANIAAFAVAFFAAAGLTPVARMIAVRYEVIDHPGPRKLHALPMPLLGGLALYVATVFGLILFIEDESRAQIFSILSAGTLVLAAGILDDRGLLHHQLKLMVAMPLAAVILLVGDVRGDLFSAWLGHTSTAGPLLDYAVTFVWVVGITAAFSILDHMDGLCSGVAAIASAFFLVLAATEGQILVGTLAATILGASLGFLRWNFTPARIFLGDGGAMFLGLMMATLGLKLRFQVIPHSSAWMIPVFVLIVPIFDTTLVTISRARRGLIPFASPGKDHFAHRLASIGVSHRTAVLLVYGLGVFGGVCALLVTRFTVAASWWLGVSALALAALAMARLERAPYERQSRS